MTPRAYVVDASAIIDTLLAAGPEGASVRAVVRSSRLVAPPILIPEVVNAISRLVRQGSLSVAHAGQAVMDFRELGVHVHDLGYNHLARLLELGQNLGTQDASYVILGEQLGLPVLTTDTRMPKGAVAAGSPCPVILPEEAA